MSWWNVAKVAATAVGAYKGSKSSGAGDSGGGGVEVEPIDIAQSLIDSARGYKQAAPDIIAAEKKLRPEMQKLALVDAKMALLGDTPELRKERDAAQAAVDAQTAAKSKAESEIQTNIAEIKNRKFDVEAQKAKWKENQEFYAGEKKKTEETLGNFLQASFAARSNTGELNKFKSKYSELYDKSTGKLKKENEVSPEEYNRLGERSGGQWKQDLKDALVTEKKLDAWDSGKKYDWLKKQAEDKDQSVTTYLRETVKGYDKSLETVTNELAASDADIREYKKEEHEAATKMLVTAENDRITELAKSGNFEAADIERLQGELQKASDAVLAGSPGMLDLAEEAVERQAAVGEKLKKAAAANEFHTIQELAPELVEMYREADPGSVELADLASKRAQQMIDRPEAGLTEQQTAMKQLREDVGLAPVGGPLGADVERETKAMLGKDELGPTTATQSVVQAIGSLLGGPAASAAETALLAAGGAAPGGAAQAEALSRFGIDQMAATARPAGAAETALLAAAQRPTEATGLAQFGADQMAATGRTVSPLESALGAAAADRLGAEQRRAGTGETDIRTAAQALLGQAAGGPSAVQQNVQAQALLDIAEGVRGASSTEQALRQAAETGLGATQRTEGAREQALTAEGLRLLQKQAGGPSGVQSAMADAAIRDMGAGARGASPLEIALGVSGMRGLDAQARGASDIEQALSASAMRGMGADVRAASEVERALGLSAMRGMDAQQRAASPEQIAMQARIGELIGGAGTLSPLEQRQVEQEMLALQQRQGRARDTGAAAAVTGRMAEARRADLGQDLGLASALLGQQDALTQAAIQEQRQAQALGQQGALGAAGLEAARQDEMMRQRALGQTGATSVAGLEAGRQDEMLRQQALGQQGVLGAAGLEATRQEEMLRQRALGQQAGVSAEQMDIARAQQLAAERLAGAGFLGEAESLQQARIQEDLQRQGIAQQAAAQTMGQETARQAEQLRRQAQGLQAGMTAEQMELARQQQEIAATQAGAGLVSGADALQQARFQELMAQQQAGAGMAATAGQMEAQRFAEMQAQQGMGMQAAGQAGSLGLQGQQQQLSALGDAGDLEAQRMASLQAQRGMGAQALGQAAGFGLQGGAQQLGALQSAGQQQAQREAQRLQGVGLAGGIAQQEFGQLAAGRELKMQQFGMGAGVAGDLAAQQRQQQTLMSGLLGQEQQAEERRMAQNVAREQQGMGALGGAFGMSKAVAPDVGAFFGRPASQAEGLGVLGMGQQQAQYGATPQGADYGVGLNMAMAQQANLTALQAAQTSASAAKKAGMYSGLGNVVGSFLGTEAGAGGIMDIFPSGGASSNPIGPNTNVGWQPGQGF